ncbi:hypothetical protein P0F65_06155 [Sphingomonas sp. I4]
MSDIGFNACLLRDLKALTEIQTIARTARSSDPGMQALAATNLHMMPAPRPWPNADRPVSSTLVGRRFRNYVRSAVPPRMPGWMRMPTSSAGPRL